MTEPRRIDPSAVVRSASDRMPPAPRPSWFDDEVPTQPQLRSRHALEQWRHEVPARFHDADLADLAHEPPELVAKLRQWAGEPDGRNLVVFGPVGVGKTHTAMAACRALIDARSTSLMFCPVVELLDDLRPGGTEGALVCVMNAEILVLDDLAAERATDWTAERLYALVNRRWMEKRPVVATTNLEPSDLAGALGERMYSRLVGGAVSVRLSGRDRRRARG